MTSCFAHRRAAAGASVLAAALALGLAATFVPSAPALAQTAPGLRAPAAPALGGGIGGGIGSGANVPAPRPSAAGASRTPILVDRIVAVVNSEVITERELEQRMGFVEGQLRRQGVPMPPRDVLERQVLERMIVDRAQLQMARDTGVRIDDQMLDRALGRMAETNGMTTAQFRDRVERDGVPFARFREDLREDLLTTRLREREVDAKVQISDAEIDTFLAEQATTTPMEYLVSQILVRVPEGASPEQIERQRARAEQALAEVKGGADFSKVAASYSDAPEALTGGSLGWRSTDRLPQLFAETIGKMAPGQVSAPLRSPNGFHVLKLDDRRAVAGKSAVVGGPVTQTRARHILVRVNETVGEAEARRRLADIRERVAAGSADFAEMARQYSADGSAGRGGDLGWIYPGDTVPEFERAMDGLKPEQVSEPVRTPFGYHLIQVLERRNDEASPERQRLLARQALRERKIDEAYQDWLRQLRDRTYVEYRGE